MVIPFYLQQSQAPKITRAAAINAHENPDEEFVSEADKKRGYVEGEVLVKYDESQVDLEKKKLAQQVKLYFSTIGVEKDREIEEENIRVYRDNNTQELQETFSSKGEVEYVEPNYVVELYNDIGEPQDPNDSRFNEQWGLDNDAVYGGTEGVDIGAKEAWEVTDRIVSTVTIGVIDTGVDYTHPELEDNIYINAGEFPSRKFSGLDSNNDGRITIQELKDWEEAPLKDFDGDGNTNLKDIFFPLNDENKFRDGIDDDGNGYIDDFFGWDFYNDDNDPFDKNGHGTNIAGIIAAKRNNYEGIAGINKDALILPLKVFGSQGEMTTISPIIEAISYANNNDIPITNSSLGMVLDKDKGPKSLERGISDAATKGYLFFTASGNGKRGEDGTLRGFDLDNSSDSVFPAGYTLDNIVTVGASTDEDKLSPSSNFGAWSVDILAPGRTILTTKTDGTYGVYNGTSVATPHVTAVASILWAYNENYLNQSPDFSEIKKQIIDYSYTIPELSSQFVKDSNGNGAKRLDFYNIVANAIDINEIPEPTITPSPSLTPIIPSPTLDAFGITKEDIDLIKNGKVGIEDFAFFIRLYQVGDPRIDYNENGDSQRDINDFVLFARYYPQYIDE